jgi:LysM repeat protein
MKTKQPKSRRKLGFIVLGLLAVLLICIAIAALFYFPQRVRAQFSRPLVLIHAPLNKAIFAQDEGLIVHATARNKKGITRIELWVDGELELIKEAPAGQAVTPLVLNTSWQPTTPGEHVLLVRAYSSDETDGQSSIRIEVEEVEPLTTSHEVEAGQTLDSIAEEFETTPEEIRELNPDLPPAGPAPGDSVEVPSGGGFSDRDEAEESDAADVPAEPADEAVVSTEDESDEDSGDEEPPSPHDAAPGSVFENLGFYLDLGEIFAADFETEPSLLVEILSFEATGSYESINCYASVGDQVWDVVDLAGASTFTVWPDDQPLPFDSTCVGIVGGGTDSVDLGILAMRIPPEHWDGITRYADSVGGEGSYSISYRISYETPTAKDPDPDMTAPINVHLDPFRYALRWEYHPELDEIPIRGFRIYLNGNLQWIEPATARLSDLPPEWFQPPCGLSYNFTVTASTYRGDLDAITESLPGTPTTIINPDPDDCERELLITFLTFNTFDLPGDGRYEDRTGDVGPAYGYFFANERQASFDMGSLHRTGIGDAPGLTDDTSYDLATFSAEATRNWHGQPTHYVDVPEGEILTVGFHIMDEDSGSGSRGRDDLICEAEAIHFNTAANEFDFIQEHTLRSENERCEIVYTIGPAPGSAVGSASSEYPPLPWLEVENLLYDEELNQHFVQLRNTGTATWPFTNLGYSLYSLGGLPFNDTYSDDFGLEPGTTTILPISNGEASQPLDFCIGIYPEETIGNYYEAWGRDPLERFCPTLPDLIVTGAEFEASGGGRLRVTVKNRGEVSVNNRTIRVETILADGTPAYLAASWPNMALEPGASFTRDLPGVSENARSHLAGGFSIVVDPDDLIAESDETNNSFGAEGLVTITFTPLGFRVPDRAGENHLQCRAEHYFNISVGAGYSIHEAEWTTQRFPRHDELHDVQTTSWLCNEEPDSYVPSESYQLELVIPNGQNLYVRFKGWETDTGRDDYLGEILTEYSLDENFGAGTHNWIQSTGGSCNDARPYGNPYFTAKWQITVNPDD